MHAVGFKSAPGRRRRQNSGLGSEKYLQMVRAVCGARHVRQARDPGAVALCFVLWARTHRFSLNLLVLNRQRQVHVVDFLRLLAQEENSRVCLADQSCQVNPMRRKQNQRSTPPASPRRAGMLERSRIRACASFSSGAAAAGTPTGTAAGLAASQAARDISKPISPPPRCASRLYDTGETGRSLREQRQLQISDLIENHTSQN